MTTRDSYSSPQAGGTFIGADGVQRRTLVAGAAWTIPVVAVAVATPAAAASVTPTLAFTNGPYAVAACGTLKDVVVQATTDGTTPAPAGTIVTVTLPAGLTWSDNTTGARALPADSNGEVVLSGIKATGSSSSTTLVASTSEATTTAPVTIDSSSKLRQWRSSGGGVQVPGAAAESTQVDWNTFVTTSGALYNGADLLASDVQAGSFGSTTDQGVAYFWWTDSTTGALKQWRSSGGGVQTTPAPAGSTQVDWNTWITSTGALYNGGTLLAGDVKAGTFGSTTDLGVAYFWWTSTTC